MKATVEQAVSDRPVKEDDLTSWANKEIIPVVRRLRDAANDWTAGTFTATTEATGAFTNVWTSDAMPTDRTWAVIVDVIGHSTAAPTQTAWYLRSALFRNVAGTVAQVGATQSVFTIETAAAMDVRFAVSGQTVQLDVRDDGVSTIAWTAYVRYLQTDEL